MKKIIVEGNNKLSGTVKIGGSKNSAVGIIPAAMLANGISVIDNVPNITDKDDLIKIMRSLGAKIKIEGERLTIDTTMCKNGEIKEALASKLRASYYFMGVLLGKYKYVEISVPGGCKIGARPVNYHLEAFEKLGAKVTHEETKYIIEAEELIGAPINLEFASVGATVNILFAAVLAKGKTTITNAAREVEIKNIAEYLISMGAKIKGHGTSKIEIEGVEELHGGNISVIPDRIEAGTYIIMGALIGKNFTVEGIDQEHVGSLLSKFDEMNIKYVVNNSSITINKAEEIKPINIKTLVYPGFPTDLGQPIHILLTQANGTSYFEETIYEKRMGHIKYLIEMDADIEYTDKTAIIKGPTKLIGKEVEAVDLRGGMSLVLGGLIGEGQTIVKNADHVLRGYEKIIQKLSKLGAKIKIEEYNEFK